MRIGRLIFRTICLSILIVALITMLCLLIFGVIPNEIEFAKIEAHYSSSFIDSEIIYALLLLCAVLMIMLVLLVVATARTVIILISYSIKKNLTH